MDFLSFKEKKFASKLNSINNSHFDGKIEEISQCCELPFPSFVSMLPFAVFCPIFDFEIGIYYLLPSDSSCIFL